MGLAVNQNKEKSTRDKLISHTPFGTQIQNDPSEAKSFHKYKHHFLFSTQKIFGIPIFIKIKLHNISIWRLKEEVCQKQQSFLNKNPAKFRQNLITFSFDPACLPRHALKRAKTWIIIK